MAAVTRSIRRIVCYQNYRILGSFLRFYSKRLHGNIKGNSLNRNMYVERELSSVIPRKQNEKAANKCRDMKESPLPSNEDDWVKVYEGPLAETIRRVKIFSLCTALASVVGTPVLIFFGKPSIPVIGKMALSFTCLTAGTVTTIFLQWFSRSYVKEMYFNSNNRSFIVLKLNLFARTVKSEFAVEDVKLVNGAMTTFEANKKNYYIHEELPEAQQVLQFIKEINEIVQERESKTEA